MLLMRVHMYMYINYVDTCRTFMYIYIYILYVYIYIYI